MLDKVSILHTGIKMIDSYSTRTQLLQLTMIEHGVSVSVIADPDSVAYFAGYWNYLGMEFGRPTLLIIPCDREPILITPLMESEMCAHMTWIADIRPWRDGGDEWRVPLAELLRSYSAIGTEIRATPNLVAGFLKTLVGKVVDIAPLINAQRMIKSPSEIEIMRKAGTVAVAMMDAARQTIVAGIPEFEITLTAMAAGTRKAAEYLSDPDDRFVSPIIQNVQILQSGSDTCMVHRRASVRRLERGDPVYLCFCGMVSFRGYKLGFDREFYVEEASADQVAIHQVAIAAQQAALATIRPGVRCEEVNAAAEAIYVEAGYSPGYRTGRSIGMSLLEAPEIKRGESMELRAGMTFAVDGGITVAGQFGGRIGDSIVVTEDGFDYLTTYPAEIAILRPR